MSHIVMRDSVFALNILQLSIALNHRKMEMGLWFILSGITKSGKVIYRKTCKKKVNYMGQPGTIVFQTLMIEFPKSQSNIYSITVLKYPRVWIKCVRNRRSVTFKICMLSELWNIIYAGFFYNIG
jgi:hypothetical protein